MAENQCVLTLHFKLDGINKVDLLDLIGEHSLDILSDVTHALHETLDTEMENMWPNEDQPIPRIPNLEGAELLYYFNVEDYADPE